MAQETEDHAVPPEGLNWWATVRDALPDDDVLAAAVAEELHEPLEDVRPSVMTATLVRRVDASLDDLKAVVDGERERARVRGVTSSPAAGERSVGAETLEDLVTETRRLADAGTLDLPAAVAVQRAAGGIAARSGMRLVLFLARLAVIRRLVWDRCVDEQRAGRLDAESLGEMGRWIFLWTEITSLVVTDGYRAAEREILARDAQARRSALEELLGVVASDALTVARLRRVAGRFGLDPDGQYRLAAIAPRRRQTRRRTGPGSTRATSSSSPVGSGTCSDRRPRGRRASAQGSACRWCCRCAAGSCSWHRPAGPASAGSPRRWTARSAAGQVAGPGPTPAARHGAGRASRRAGKTVGLGCRGLTGGRGRGGDRPHPR